MNYYLYEVANTGHGLALRPVPYTEKGFPNYGKARRYRDKHRSEARVIREDRVVSELDKFKRQNN